MYFALEVWNSSLIFTHRPRRAHVTYREDGAIVLERPKEKEKNRSVGISARTEKITSFFNVFVLGFSVTPLPGSRQKKSVCFVAWSPDRSEATKIIS